jgi:hypothetical protein
LVVVLFALNLTCWLCSIPIECVFGSTLRLVTCHHDIASSALTILSICRSTSTGPQVRPPGTTGFTPNPSPYPSQAPGMRPAGMSKYVSEAILTDVSVCSAIGQSSSAGSQQLGAVCACLCVN